MKNIFESELEAIVVKQRCDRSEREGTCPPARYGTSARSITVSLNG